MRQPHSRNAAELIAHELTRSTSVASRLPTGTAAWGQLDQNARDRSGLCSATRRTAPPHSPPTAKPWMKRSATSIAGAQ